MGLSSNANQPSVSSASDVALNGVTAGQVLAFNSTTGKWVNSSGSAGPQGNPGDASPTSSGLIWNGSVSLSSLTFPGTHRGTVTGNTQFTALPTVSSAISGTLTLVVKQTQNTGGYIIQWPDSGASTVYFAIDQDPPQIPSAPNNYSIFHLFWDGSRWTIAEQGKYLA